MAWLSIFKRKTGAAARPAPVSAAASAVQQARSRARRRLIGAVVLLGIGIIGFPLVFENQPRPIRVDIPIELPRKDPAPPLVMPPARPASVGAPASAPGALAPDAPAPRDDAAVAPAAPARIEPAPTRAPVAAPPSTPAAKKPGDTRPAASAADAARAKALLDGQQVAKVAPPLKAEPAAKSVAVEAREGRFVVQVGAFADAAAAREVRLKVEQLGLKTYTQIAETPAGRRIRVRAGPFASRDEAEQALAKAKAAGLPAVVLTL